MSGITVDCFTSSTAVAVGRLVGRSRVLCLTWHSLRHFCRGWMS